MVQDLSDSIVAKLEPPSTAIVESLRQRQFEDWVSGDADNWLEQIAQIVSNVEIEIPEFYNLCLRKS